MSFVLPELKYAHDALEPHIDAKTMEIHHGKHHAAYVNNLNAALEKYPELQEKSLEDLIKDIKTLPQDIQNAVRNNGGGHWNHSFFWEILSPTRQDGSQMPRLAEAVNKSFGSFTAFQEEFAKAAMGRFGSGWVWLIKKDDGSLAICSTPNQDNPLMNIAEVQGTPILGLDVWEHAYYLNFQNRRADYVTAFWSVVDWQKVDELLAN
jgi:Fe-Mn family superoxide dismutase